MQEMQDSDSSTRRRQPLLTVCAVLAIAGCAAQATGPASMAADDAGVCASLLVGESDGAGGGLLDSSDISAVNWNVHKGKDPEWVRDLLGAEARADLLILQEAVAASDAIETLAGERFRSFSEGFGFDEGVSGVMTLSSARPLAECDLVSHEPWLRTRKATLITEYALTGTKQTLLVVNMHGINFTLGVSDFEEQLVKAQSIAARHEGPVLFSGDFNTWRGRRKAMLDDVLGEIGLVALKFSDDHRKRFRGWPLDHMYVRGLEPIYATSREVDSSDHNPMSVRLQLAGAAD